MGLCCLQCWPLETRSGTCAGVPYSSSEKTEALSPWTKLFFTLTKVTLLHITPLGWHGMSWSGETSQLNPALVRVHSEAASFPSLDWPVAAWALRRQEKLGIKGQDNFLRDPCVLGVSLTSRSDNYRFWCLSCEIQKSYPDEFWCCFWKHKLSPTDPENTINVRSQSAPQHWHGTKDRKISLFAWGL